MILVLFLFGKIPSVIAGYFPTLGKSQTCDIGIFPVWDFLLRFCGALSQLGKTSRKRAGNNPTVGRLPANWCGIKLGKNFIRQWFFSFFRKTLSKF